MCDFCHQHGEGKRWYLLMENYSQELFAQENRKEFMHDFFANFDKDVTAAIEGGKKLQKAPRFVQRLMNSLTVRKYKKEHYGQLVPIEDLEKIVSMLKIIVRIPCVCRKFILGKEARYCFGVGASIHGTLSDMPEFAANFEVLKQDQAIKVLRQLDEKGLMHSVWTFKTPFIGGICNCDQDCLAYKFRMQYNLPLFFKAEYVAQTDWDKCTGCRDCKMVCQFGAILYSDTNEKCSIDSKSCFGCGVCRAVCPEQAITLIERTSVPELVKEW